MRNISECSIHIRNPFRKWRNELDFPRQFERMRTGGGGLHPCEVCQSHQVRKGAVINKYAYIYICTYMYVYIYIHTYIYIYV